MSTVTVTATVELANTPPRVRLDVTDVGSPNLFAATVTRLDPDGRVVPVRTADGNPLVLTTSGANRVGTVWDYEVPYGATVTYSTMESPTTTSAEVAVDPGEVWLIHPGIPGLSMPLSVASFGPETRPVERGIFRPMGRKYPIVVTDGSRQSREGSLELNTFTSVEATAFEALTDDSSVLLLNVPATLNWGVNSAYVSIGDIEESRLVDYAPEPRRLQTLPYTVVDRPAGGTTAERTLLDFLDFPSLADVSSAYPTLAAAQAGP